jgi:hypothetical protein
MPHDINITEVDNMSQATAIDLFNEKKDEKKKVDSWQLLFIAVPLKTLANVDILNGLTGCIIITSVIQCCCVKLTKAIRNLIDIARQLTCF